MTGKAWLEVCDSNLAESWREISRWNPHTDMMEQEDRLFVAGADPYPAANVALRTNHGARSAAEVFVKKARAFFLERGRHFTLLLRAHQDDDLIAQSQALKLHLISDSPGMLIQRPPDAAAPAPDTTLKTVVDLEGVRDFAQVFAASFVSLGMPEAVAQRMIENAEALLRPYLLVFVAYAGAVPAATALVLLSHGIAGIYCVGTVEQARGRGLGELCVRSATRAAFDHGARGVMLQATEYSKKLYQRIGFEEYSHYPWYICPFR